MDPSLYFNREQLFPHPLCLLKWVEPTGSTSFPVPILLRLSPFFACPLAFLHISFLLSSTPSAGPLHPSASQSFPILSPLFFHLPPAHIPFRTSCQFSKLYYRLYLVYAKRHLVYIYPSFLILILPLLPSLNLPPFPLPFSAV